MISKGKGLCDLVGVSLHTNRQKDIFNALCVSSLYPKNPRLQLVIILKYGFDGASPMTYLKIGKFLGITITRVKQMHDKAVYILWRRRFKLASVTNSLINGGVV